MLVASKEGGVNIEEVAASNPDAIVKVPIDINEGMTRETAMNAVKQLEFPEDKQEEVADVFMKLYDLFISKDATMVEINPFAEDSQGQCEAYLLLINNNYNTVYLMDFFSSKIIAWMPS